MRLVTVALASVLAVSALGGCATTENLASANSKIKKCISQGSFFDIAGSGKQGAEQKCYEEAQKICEQENKIPERLDMISKNTSFGSFAAAELTYQCSTPYEISHRKEIDQEAFMR